MCKLIDPFRLGRRGRGGEEGKRGGGGEEGGRRGGEEGRRGGEGEVEEGV